MIQGKPDSNNNYNKKAVFEKGSGLDIAMPRIDHKIFSYVYQQIKYVIHYYDFLNTSFGGRNYEYNEYDDLNNIEEQIDYYKLQENKKIVEEVELLISLSEYKENSFTSTIKNIIENYKKYNKISEKQKLILIKHLVYTNI